MNTEQLRAEFEAWAVGKWPGVSFAPDQNNCGIVVPERYKHPKLQAAWEAYQAGRAALQSQDREDALRYRWLLEQAWFQEAFDRFDPDDGGYLPRFVGECARIIDHARRVEGEAK